MMSRNLSFQLSVAMLFLEEAEERLTHVVRYGWVPAKVVSAALCGWLVLCCAGDLFHCSSGDTISTLVDVRKELDDLRKLCGSQNAFDHGEVANVSRSECLLAIKRSVASLCADGAADPSLPLPTQLQKCVQSTVDEMYRLRDDADSALSENVRLKRDLQMVVGGCETSLEYLGSACGSSLCPALSPRSGVAAVSNLVVMTARIASEKLSSLRSVCEECNSVIERARRREERSHSRESSPASHRVEDGAEALLVERCKELVSELLVLRTDRRTSTAAIDQRLMESELMVTSVRNAIENLRTSLDIDVPIGTPALDLVRTSGSCGEAVEGAISEKRQVSATGPSLAELDTSIRTQLELCVLAVIRQLREKDRVISAAATLLGDALRSCSSAIRDEVTTDSLLAVASGTAHSLHSLFSELQSVRASLKQSQHHTEELRTRLEGGETTQLATLEAQTESVATAERLLNEALQRQVAASAQTARLQRTLMDFAGSIAASTLYADDAGDRVDKTGDVGASVSVVEERWLDGIVRHVAQRMQESESLKGKLKLVTSELESVRIRMTATEVAAREAELNAQSVEVGNLTRIAEATARVELLRNALSERSVELQKMHQRVERHEKQVETLKAEISNDARSFDNERCSLLRAQSTLLAENTLKQQQLDELRQKLWEGEKSLHEFLHNSRVVSLVDATNKIRSLSANAVCGVLMLDEMERRSEILQSYILSFPTQESTLLSVCACIASTLSEREVQRLPDSVHRLNQRVQKYKHLLGNPTKVPGPTRAVAVLALQKLAETVELAESVSSTSFVSNLIAAVADFRTRYLIANERIAKLEKEVNSGGTLMEMCDRRVWEMVKLLRQANSVGGLHSGSQEGPRGECQTDVVDFSVAQLDALQSLALECGIAAKYIHRHTEANRKALETLRHVYDGESIFEACSHANEMMMKYRESEEDLRAQLLDVRSQLEACRHSIEESFSVFAETSTLNDAKKVEFLQQQCAAAAAELRRLKDEARVAQGLLASAGHDTHDGDICRNLAELLKEEEKQRECVNLLQSEKKCARKQLQELGNKLRATEEMRNAELEEVQNRNDTLRTRLEEQSRQNNEWCQFVSTCAGVVGCPVENMQFEKSKNKILQTLRNVASSQSVCAEAGILCTTAQEEQLQCHREGANAAVARLDMPGNERYRCQLLEFVGSVEEVLSELCPEKSESFLTTKDAPLELRVCQAAGQLCSAKDAVQANIQKLEAEIASAKKKNKAQKREMEDARKALHKELEVGGPAVASCALSTLTEGIRKKLRETLDENRKLGTALEELRIDNAQLERTLRCVEQQLSETHTQLQCITESNGECRGQNATLQERVDPLTEPTEEASRKFRSPTQSPDIDADAAGLAQVHEVCFGRGPSIQHRSEEPREFEDNLRGNCRSDAAAVMDVGVAPKEQRSLLERLQQVTKERDVLTLESEKLVERVQSVLYEHLNVQQELLSYCSNANENELGESDTTVGDIVQLCVERLEHYLSETKTLREDATSAKLESARMAEEVAALRGRIKHLQDDNHVAERDSLRQNAEFESLSRQLQAFFNDALHMAVNDLRLRLPPVTDTSAIGALYGLQSLFDCMLSKCRDSIAFDEEKLNCRLNELKGKHAKDLKSLHRVFCAHVTTYTDDPNDEDSARSEGDGSSPVNLPTTDRLSGGLTPEHIVAAGDALHHVHSNVCHIVWACIRHAERAPPPSLHTMGLPALTALLGEVVVASLERAELLQGAMVAGSRALGILPVDPSLNQQHMEEWLECFTSEIQRVQRSGEGCELLLNHLEILLQDHGISVGELVSNSRSQSTLSNVGRLSQDNQLGSPRGPSSSVAVQDVMEFRSRALLGALRDLIAQFEHRYSTLTSEWQALTDQNNRLKTSQQANEEEFARVQEQMQELRHAVRKKVEDDRKVEQSLRDLDNHLDMQARELAMKYRADQEAISRQFAELRGSIRRVVIPTQEQLGTPSPKYDFVYPRE
ncbi:uncharacterized protein TEOVI_000782500 [Trypanosoma equiperdum]|uniref:Uncharacterized protein n=1 Tax=Trypanosoma equiperdum TaxID=5694 RepID=A0A1G4I5J3_TRYEQ|nr:hypothetical protein, conserved [Trypanosoma equiperdum]